MLAILMIGLQIREWDELMEIVKSVLWVERVFDRSHESIREEVMQILHTSVGNVTSPTKEEAESEKSVQGDSQYTH